MIEHAYKDLYNQDSVRKQLIIEYDGGEITNTDLYSESFELTESLCSESELRFGSCEASVIKFQMANIMGPLKNKELIISEVLNELEDTPFQFGKYKVASDVPSGDRNYRNITAYDAMYDVINAEVVDWYDGLAFPITQKDFRDSFFQYLGVTQEDTTLVQDEMLIEKTIDADSISGKDVITALCELNGVFGHINRQGNFEYISLERKVEYQHPSDTLYPSDEIYPGMVLDLEYEKQDIPPSLYQSCEYEDFETQRITKLQIRQEENDIGAIVGTGTNTYIVQDNFLVYGKSASELSVIARRMFAKVFGVQYRPFKVVVKGNPCIEVGDMVNIQARYKNIEGYVLERTIKGIQALKDTFEAKGVYEYEEKVNSVQRDVKKLKNKTNVLLRTVEETKSLLADAEKGLQTMIRQLADSIAITIDEKGNVVTSLTLDGNGMAFAGNKVVFNFKNFSLDKDGNVYVNGRIESTTPDGIKSVEINNNAIRFYSWAENGEEVGRVGSIHFSNGRNAVAVACEQGDKVSLGVFNGREHTTIFEFDSENMDSTPYIANTTSGTLFSGHSGGIVVENGLIREWDLDTSSGTLSVITGLSWNSNGITSIQRADVVIKNGLICSWDINKTTY